ncbi:MAG: hypothetical protein ABSB25_03935 [Sedimentisphaerales bacterium]|jgi:hypothetical protein
MTAESVLSEEHLTTKKPEEVFAPDFLPTYTQLHQDIWHRLIHVDVNLQILETIGRFPLHHLYAPQDNVFWSQVYWNFVYMSVIFLHSLVSDNAKDAHTLPKFRNIVLSHLRTNSLKLAYRKRLNKTKLNKKLAPIRNKIKVMRHEVVAHRFLNTQGQLKSPHIEGVNIPELRKIFEDTKQLFESCCFSIEYFTTFYPPNVPGYKQNEKDIEQILCLIVKNSYWLNQPERHAPFWDQIKPHKPSEDIEELNKWRAKFNLPPA